MMAPAHEVENLDTSLLRENVIVSGFVESERGISTGTAMNVGDIEVRYDGFDSYKGKFVRVEGYVDEFRGKRYVVAQSISLI
jgi:DNA/RNA endonuclease YhcR with UshA esterase domain